MILIKMPQQTVLSVLTVFFLSPICSIIYMKHNLYRRLPGKKNKKIARNINFTSHYIDNIFHSIIQRLVFLLLASISLNFKKRIPQIQIGLLLTLTYIYILIARAYCGRNVVTKEIISIFPMRVIGC